MNSGRDSAPSGLASLVTVITIKRGLRVKTHFHGFSLLYLRSGEFCRTAKVEFPSEMLQDLSNPFIIYRHHRQHTNNSHICQTKITTKTMLQTKEPPAAIPQHKPGSTPWQKSTDPGKGWKTGREHWNSQSYSDGIHPECPKGFLYSSILFSRRENQGGISLT